MIPDYPYYGFPNYMNYINKKSSLNNSYIQNPNLAHTYKAPTDTVFQGNLSQSIPKPPPPHYSQFKENYIPAESFNTKSNTNTYANSSNLYTNASNGYNQQLSSCNKVVNNNQKQQPMFSILGLDLYFDDLLILALIFFLFNEDSHDYFLIMILFLLLMN